MARGSGIAGLAGMTRQSPLPGDGAGHRLVRPLLDVPKSRLIATLAAAGIAFADDPSNRDPRFTRARLRALMPALAREGLDRGGWRCLPRRLQRAEAALEAVVDAAWTASVAPGPLAGAGPVAFASRALLRCRRRSRCGCSAARSRAIGDEGPVELGKLEALQAALARAHGRRPAVSPHACRRPGDAAPASCLTIERAPPRRPARSRMAEP